MLDEQRRVSKELVKSITQNRSWQEVFRLKEPGLRKGRARGFLAVEPQGRFRQLWFSPAGAPGVGWLKVRLRDGTSTAKPGCPDRRNGEWTAWEGK